MHRLTDEYRLSRRLGRGGMGEVWEAIRVKDDDIVVPCAIKLLHADFTETARERRLFFDEARIATQLDHGRIVKVTDLGTARDGRPFLVMERVDGVDLRNFLRVAREQSIERLDLDVVTYIVGEVLAALVYAHGRTVGGAEAGVIHSDVTPGNIMLSSSGEVKLTDFGIARFAATAGPMSRAIGTPRYMSPEQLCGEPQRETDIYGLGVVLHELLEGERFLDGLTPDEFRRRVLMGPPPKLERDDVPDWLDELREQMLATDPTQRPDANRARAVLAERCPRYLAAAGQLAADYVRLIGRRRAGVTEHDANERGDRAFVPPPAEVEADGADDGNTDEAARDLGEDGEVVAPTELLPEAEARPSHNPGAARWLAIASAIAAVAFFFLGLSFLVQALREPAPEPKPKPEVAKVEAASAQPTPEVAPVAAPDPSPPAVEPVDESKVEPENPNPTEPEQPSVEPEPEPEPEPESKPQPKKSAKTKAKSPAEVGVMFLVETRSTAA